ncbi:MAG: Hsp70 family protein [Oscillospiraceae bacterium]|nr:Hsp70 family protein [Oscillospiraceae bacterium]
MTLTEWLDIRSEDIDETADIFAQLLAVYMTSADIIRPDAFRIDEGTLVRISDADSFDDVYRPMDGDDDSAFVIGLMMYHKLTGDTADAASAALLSLAAAEDPDISLCSAPVSSLAPIVSGLTRIDRSRRLTAAAALDMMAELYPSKAVMEYTDTDGTVMYTDEIPLTGGVTIYRPAVMGEAPRCAFPLTDEISVVWRRKTRTVTVDASHLRSEEPVRREGMDRIGVYKGKSFFTAAMLHDGVLSDMGVMPLSDYDKFVSGHTGEIVTAEDPAAAMAAYISSDGPVLAVYLGHRAYVYARGTTSASADSDLGDAMTEALFEDMLKRIAVSYHTDLSDEILCRSTREDVYRAAERIKCALSFGMHAEERIPLGMQGDAVIGYDRYALDNILRGILRQLRSAVREAMSKARLSLTEGMEIHISGGAMVMPCFEELFGSMGKVCWHQSYMAARGACLSDLREQKENSPVLTYDIGTMGMSLGAMPIFEPLVKAGTDYPQVRAEICSDGLTAEDGVVTLRIYRREGGMEHVRSTFDPEGSAISHIATARADVSDDMRVIFLITADADGVHIIGRRQRLKKPLFGKATWEDAGDAEVRI